MIPDSRFDFDFETRLWRMQRAAWILLAAVVLAAALGFAGGGPLTRRRQANLEYDRYVRSGTETTIDILAETPALVIGRDYLSRFSLRYITPQPVSMRADGANLVLHFDATPPFKVTLTLQAPAFYFGSVDATFDTVRIRQFVWP